MADPFAFDAVLQRPGIRRRRAAGWVLVVAGAALLLTALLLGHAALHRPPTADPVAHASVPPAHHPLPEPAWLGGPPVAVPLGLRTVDGRSIDALIAMRNRATRGFGSESSWLVAVDQYARRHPTPDGATLAKARACLFDDACGTWAPAEAYAVLDRVGGGIPDGVGDPGSVLRERVPGWDEAVRDVARLQVHGRPPPAQRPTALIGVAERALAAIQVLGSLLAGVAAGAVGGLLVLSGAALLRRRVVHVRVDPHWVRIGALAVPSEEVVACAVAGDRLRLTRVDGSRQLCGPFTGPLTPVAEAVIAVATPPTRALDVLAERDRFAHARRELDTLAAGRTS